MGITETIVFYVLFGVAVAVGVLLVDDTIGRGERAFRVGTAVVFWPLYLPLLLRRNVGVVQTPQSNPASARADDELSAAIAQAEAELDAALASLDGWAEDVLAREADRVGELRSAWRAQAERIRELDLLLSSPEMAVPHGGTDCQSVRDAGRIDNPAYGESDAPFAVTDRLRQSEQARLENLRRLREVRRRLHDDLVGTLAWVREVVTMIHLAKFTGAPASRAEELVAQIAAAVEGLSEVTHWRGGAGMSRESAEPLISIAR